MIPEILPRTATTGAILVIKELLLQWFRKTKSRIFVAFLWVIRKDHGSFSNAFLGGKQSSVGRCLSTSTVMIVHSEMRNSTSRGIGDSLQGPLEGTLVGTLF